jgi:Holliday junction resolvase RusA-like endonuclease
MPEHLIVIPGKPIGKARPRFARMGKFIKVYSAQAKEENSIKKEIYLQWIKRPLDCPIILHITALFPTNKGSKNAVASMLDGTTRHVKKPDLDNIIKFYTDLLIGWVIRDDSIIYEIEASKGYAQAPQTIIRLEW